MVGTNTVSDGTLQSRVDIPVIAGANYYFKVGIASGSAYSYIITPNQTCNGNVNADPPMGSFVDYGDVFLSAPAGGLIYYSLNGAGYQVYTNGPTVTPTNATDVTFSGSIATKTAGGTGWNAGFNSVETISGNGFAEGVAPTNTWNIIIGLQGAYAVPNSDVDYEIYISSAGLVYVYEDNTQRGQFGSYNPGDRFRIVRNGTIVSYYHNGGLFYVSAVPSTAILHLACVMNEQGDVFGPCYLRNGGIANETAVVVSSGNSNGVATLSAYSPGGQTNTWTYTVQAASASCAQGQLPDMDRRNKPACPLWDNRWTNALQNQRAKQLARDYIRPIQHGRLLGGLGK